MKSCESDVNITIGKECCIPQMLYNHNWVNTENNPKITSIDESYKRLETIPLKTGINSIVFTV